MKLNCLSIFPTNRCNCLCYYCAYQTNYAMANSTSLCDKSDSLTRELMTKALDEVVPFTNSLEISGGGEPLCHPDFPWLAREIVRRNLGAKLITNGFLFKDAAAEAASELSMVEFSVNYYDHKSCAALRSVPEYMFDIVTNHMRHLVLSKPRCIPVAKVVLTRRNYETLPQIKAYLASVGITNLSITPSYGRTVEDIVPPETFSPERRARSKPKCNWCQRNIDHPVIGADGGIYSCCYFAYVPSMKLGDLASQSLAEVLQQPRFDTELCAKVEQVIADYRQGKITVFPDGKWSHAVGVEPTPPDTGVTFSEI